MFQYKTLWEKSQNSDPLVYLNIAPTNELKWIRTRWVNIKRLDGIYSCDISPSKDMRVSCEKLYGTNACKIERSTQLLL